MKIVLCHGCFDILHVGHFEHFRAAREYGDKLIVSVTAEKWVRLAKGEGHPAHTDEERLAMLRDLKMVDEVFLCDAKDAVPAIFYYRPYAFAKGSDYAARGVKDSERRACEMMGTKIFYTQTKKRSVREMVSAFK